MSPDSRRRALLALAFAPSMTAFAPARADDLSVSL